MTRSVKQRPDTVVQLPSAAISGWVIYLFCRLGNNLEKERGLLSNFSAPLVKMIGLHCHGAPEIWLHLQPVRGTPLCYSEIQSHFHHRCYESFPAAEMVAVMSNCVTSGNGLILDVAVVTTKSKFIVVNTSLRLVVMWSLAYTSTLW